MEREELQQAEELLTQMKYNQALQIVENIEKKETLTQDDLLTWLDWKVNHLISIPLSVN